MQQNEVHPDGRRSLQSHLSTPGRCGVQSAPTAAGELRTHLDHESSEAHRVKLFQAVLKIAAAVSPKPTMHNDEVIR